MAAKEIKLTITRTTFVDGKLAVRGTQVVQPVQAARDLVGAGKAVEGHVKLDDAKSKPADKPAEA